MALEDLSAYTETDPNARIAVTASRVTWTALTRDEDAYVYADKGVDYFSANFKIEFTYRPTGYAGTKGTGRNSIWSLANLVDDFKGIDDASGDWLLLAAKISLAGNQILQLVECDGGTQYGSSNSVDLTVDTDYYITVVRDETVGTYGTLYAYIYSNIGRTTLLDTLSVALHTSKKDFRYIYACQTQDTNEAAITHSGYTEALEIVSRTSTPIVTTEACTDIVTTTATGNGSISDLGSSSVTEHGHCWKQGISKADVTDPTTADSKTANGAGSLGAFTSSITGLTEGLVTGVRAYATNSAGTVYGANVFFTAGVPSTQRQPREIGIKDDEFRFIGEDGKEYKLTGTAV